MQIRFGPDGLNLGVNQAAQAHAQRGKIRSEKFSVADQRKVRFELGLFLARVSRYGFAAHFFLALDEELDVNWELAVVSPHQRLDGFNFHPELALIVYRAARVNVVLALGWLERRRNPLIKRFGGLDVVMGIAERSRLSRGIQPVGVNQGMAFGGNDLDVLHSNPAQFGCNEVGSPLHIRFVLGQGANAWNAKKVLEFSQKSLLIFTSVIDRGRRHGLPFSLNRLRNNLGASGRARLQSDR